MAKINSKVHFLCPLMALVILSLAHEAMCIPLCNIDTNDLEKCRAAVTGNNPPSPTQQCCGVIRRADLTCLCGFKAALPTLGIDPAKAVALPAKCGVNKIPPQCRA